MRLLWCGGQGRERNLVECKYENAADLSACPCGFAVKLTLLRGRDRREELGVKL